MAEGPTRLIVFYGSEAERRTFVKQKGFDDSRVLLAQNATRALLGRTEPVDTWYCSGRHGLSLTGMVHLYNLIRLINDLHGKDAA